VLYQLPLRDTLLRAAQHKLYVVRWSARILEEVARNLIEDQRASDAQAERLIGAMRRAFDDAEVPEPAIAALEPAMGNHPDRHLLAAAVASHHAQAIVTSNLRHFPPEACAPFEIDVLHPDAFLCDLYERAPQAIHAALADQVAALSRPPMSMAELLDRLAVTAPEFVAQVRSALVAGWVAAGGANPAP
jgi:hypothetical protein